MFSCIRLFLLIPFLLACTQVSAAKLTLNPTTCVVKKGDACQAKIAAKITHMPAGKHICLVATALRFKACQVTSKQTVFQVNIDSKDAINFVLIDSTTNNQITSAQLAIATFEPVATRKRRSFAWSFHRDSE